MIEIHTFLQFLDENFCKKNEISTEKSKNFFLFISFIC